MRFIQISGELSAQFCPRTNGQTDGQWRKRYSRCWWWWWCFSAGLERGRQRKVETRSPDGRSANVGGGRWPGGLGADRGLSPRRDGRAGRVSPTDRPGNQLGVSSPARAAPSPSTERQLGSDELRAGAPARQTE